MHTCPVCKWEIKDGGVRVKVGSKEVVVCCPDCAAKATQRKKKPSK